MITNEELALQFMEVEGVYSVDIENKVITLLSVANIMDLTELMRLGGGNREWTIQYWKVHSDYERNGNVLTRRTEDIVMFPTERDGKKLALCKQ